MKLSLLQWPLVAWTFLILSTASSQEIRNETETKDIHTTEHGRSKRTLVYTFNSCAGVLFALSVPLLITGRNIFMSYNFEANYNMPTDSTDFTQGILKKGDNDQIHEAEARKTRAAIAPPMVPPVPKQSSISRKKFYRTIELNLQRYGFAGKRCILRMICDLAESPLDHENGVLGDLLQLIFTPSLSQDETLPSEFNRAEQLGRNERDSCLAVVWSLEAIATEPHQNISHQVQDRAKRTLVYTTDSATGVLFALSVPLLIPSRNIFLAYNFEANYGMPGKASDFTQGALKRVDNDQIDPDGEGEGAEEAKRSIRAKGTRRFTRKKVYRMVELSLTRHGYDGKKCILRMICELAKRPVDAANGIVGDLLQLLFTPSASYYEGLPWEFYRAEENGKHENCTRYISCCPKDPLDAISLFL
uniref:Uncharacterized protein n=1 Tax=Anopheles epiroticus TaxID=199890 RepID=A0A182P8Y0_9DIPT